MAHATSIQMTICIGSASIEENMPSNWLAPDAPDSPTVAAEDASAPKSVMAIFGIYDSIQPATVV